jgi:hypothetical protein
MGGPGVEQRMKLLRNAADQQFVKPFRTHGWSATVSSENPSGEYLIVEATKSGVTRRVGLLYSSATDNLHYKALDAVVDHIFTNGELYMIDSFAYGIAKPVTPVGDFFPALVAWNKKLAPVSDKPLPPTGPRTVRIITAENPLAGIWSRLDQFASVTLAEKLIVRRADERSIELKPEAIKTKAAGLAFTIRNASDYFRDTPFESLNKRILSLYYGALALASAEMMASPTGPTDLDEIEGITKQGHGLYTVPSATDDFGGLSIGVLATGFFPRWVSFLGHDTSQYPKAKAKTSSDLEKQPAGTVVMMRNLLSAIPELGDLFLEVYATPPSWVTPVYQLQENKGGPGFGRSQQIGSSYIHLVDKSGRVQEESIKDAGWSLAEITPIPSAADSGQSFRARVDHPGRDFWFEALMLHRSPFKEGPTLIMPVLGGVSEHRIISVVTLYALSILVRYMPSAWRRVEGGNWDEHLALIKNAVGVFERLLPEQFLESIINERVSAKQPERW